MAEIDRWIEIAKECNYLPENDLKVIRKTRILYWLLYRRRTVIRPLVSYVFGKAIGWRSKGTTQTRSVLLSNYGFFAPLPVRRLARSSLIDSPPGSCVLWLVRPCAWLIRPLACSPPGSFPPGWFAPWLLHFLACSPLCLADSFLGLFAPGWFVPPLVEYTGDSLLRLAFQFTERQQTSVASRHWLIASSINVLKNLI